MAQDYRKAAEWFRKAAEQGEPNAQNNLGWCYEKGAVLRHAASGIVAAGGLVLGGRMPLFGREWFRKAAEQGEPNAQNNLGWCYEKGKGVEQSDTLAAEWCKKAAEQGNSQAQYNLAIYPFDTTAQPGHNPVPHALRSYSRNQAGIGHPYVPVGLLS